MTDIKQYQDGRTRPQRWYRTRQDPEHSACVCQDRPEYQVVLMVADKLLLCKRSCWAADGRRVLSRMLTILGDLRRRLASDRHVQCVRPYESDACLSSRTSCGVVYLLDRAVGRWRRRRDQGMYAHLGCDDRRCRTRRRVGPPNTTLQRAALRPAAPSGRRSRRRHRPRSRRLLHFGRRRPSFDGSLGKGIWYLARILT